MTSPDCTVMAALDHECVAGADRVGPLVAAEAARLLSLGDEPALAEVGRARLRGMALELLELTSLVVEVRARLRSGVSPELRVEGALVLLDAFCGVDGADAVGLDRVGA